MRLMFTEKRKFNYMVLAFLIALVAIWTIKYFNDGAAWPF